MRAAFVTILAGSLASSAVPFVQALENPPEQHASADQFVGFSIMLHVENIRRSVEFYRDVLGFELGHCVVGAAEELPELPTDGREPYAAELFAGSQRIGLQRNSGEVRLPASGARYHFQVDNMAALLSRVEDSRITAERLVRDAEGKPFLFAVHDPDGHWLFFQRAGTSP